MQERFCRCILPSRSLEKIFSELSLIDPNP